MRQRFDKNIYQYQYSKQMDKNDDETRIYHTAKSAR